MTLFHASRSHAGWALRRAGGLTLVLVILIGGLSLGARVPSVLGQDDAAPNACELDNPGIGASEFVQTELFFGTAKPDGAAVTQQEWSEFLDTEITPRFPDGLTVMTGMGQWQEEDGDIVQERSMLLILLYPQDVADDAGAAIEEIRAAYESTFQQESVLRADEAHEPVCVSF